MTFRGIRRGRAVALTVALGVALLLPLACAAPVKREPEAGAGSKPAAREAPPAGQASGSAQAAGAGAAETGRKPDPPAAAASARPADPNHSAPQAAAPPAGGASTAEAGQPQASGAKEPQRRSPPGSSFIAATPPAQNSAPQPVAPAGQAPGVSGSPAAGGGAPARRHGPASIPDTDPPPTVRMIPDAAEPVVGSRLTVRIEIEGARDVTSVPFHVTYNPDVLRFDEAVEGGFLAAAGQTAFFAAPMSSGAELVVGLSRLGGGPGAVGDGQLCELRFTVVGPGDAALGFLRAKVRDSENRIVPSAFDTAPVVVR